MKNMAVSDLAFFITLCLALSGGDSHIYMVYEELISKTSYIHSYMCYSFADHVTAKEPIFNTKFTVNGKC